MMGALGLAMGMEVVVVVEVSSLGEVVLVWFVGCAVFDPVLLSELLLVLASEIELGFSSSESESSG